MARPHSCSQEVARGRQRVVP